MNEFESTIKRQALMCIAEGAQKQIPAFFVLPSITALVFWSTTSVWLILPWLAASYALAILRWHLINTVCKKDLTTLEVNYWRRLTVASSWLSGCLWGVAIFIFFNAGSLGQLIYLIAAIFGLTSTALIMCAYLPAAYYAFIIPSLSSLIVRFLMEGTSEFTGFAILLILYFFVVFRVMENQSKLAMDSLRLRFENLDLLESLRHEKNSAEAANATKSKFLAAASHDLRQPLHSISLFAAALEHHAENPDAIRLIHYINHSVASLDELLSVLLDISKLDAGVITPRRTHTLLQPLLLRIGNEYEPQARSKGLGWQLQVGSDLVVFTDPTLLETVVRNLVTNAIRYTRDGFVNISCDAKGERIALKVSDSGVGIPQAFQSAVFEEFVQLENAETEGAKGVGLGLAIVARIATLLDFELSLESTPIDGTVFTITIPVGDRNQIKVEHAISESDFDGAGTAVLVIDDDASVRQAMRELLAGWSYKVICVSSGEEALKVVQAGEIKPGIIVTDYQLAEGKTGIEALEQLRKIIPDFEAILVTGGTAEQDIRNIYQSRYSLLHKPVKPGKLRAFLRDAQRLKTK